ncbi:MAG: hypothetical protein NTZ83_01615, partial [Candidatus Pacearchaeota archaeon]|nr:hypothetical protein [Candidatus Pacearchaeota archaeon]
PTQDIKITTHSAIPSNNPTVPVVIGGLKYPNLDISTRNRGVPTDRQTNQQTNQHIPFSANADRDFNGSSLNRASEILDNLDKLKKEVRLKFKRLTNQEMTVFSTLYTLDSQGEIVDYSILSSKLKLSESSIRDYIGKIQKKGIPITKEKLNNKRVILHISQDLRKIATLDTILKLREL